MIPPETLAAALRVAEHRAWSAMLAQHAAQPPFMPAPEPQRTAQDGVAPPSSPEETGH